MLLFLLMSHTVVSQVLCVRDLDKELHNASDPKTYMCNFFKRHEPLNIQTVMTLHEVRVSRAHGNPVEDLAGVRPCLQAQMIGAPPDIVLHGL